MMNIIISVQALRAIAAFAVVLCHFDQVSLMLKGRPDDPIALYALSSGVDLFFVISGFVMVYSSQDLFDAKGGTGIFLVRRIARIVPPYWLATVIAIPLMYLPTDWISLLTSFFFIPSWARNGSIYPIYGVGWTLNFEMYFYALFSLAILLPRHLAVTMVCALLSGIVLLGWWLKPQSAVLLYWSDPIILEFMIGVMLAELYIRGFRLPTGLRIVFVVCGIIAIGFFAPRTPPSGYRILQWGLPATMIFGGTVIGKQIDFGRFRSLVKLLGDSSYALYLVHSLVGAVTFGAVLFLRHRGVNIPLLPVLALGVMASVLLSIFAEAGFRNITRYTRVRWMGT